MTRGVQYLLAAAALAALSGPSFAKPALSNEKLIARALSAAPKAVAAHAAVMSMTADGKTTELRKGTNGWTCLPYDMGTPTESPLCFDKAGLAWEMAAMSGKAPDADAVGLSYMLKGGSVWSATNPDATTPDAGGPVLVPPHVMILNAKLAAASGYPSGEAHPDTTRPFVLFAGTPAAVVIMPVSAKLPHTKR